MRFLFRKKQKGTGRKVFLAWVCYQAVKGTLTTSFIWIPLAYFYFFAS